MKKIYFIFLSALILSLSACAVIDRSGPGTKRSITDTPILRAEDAGQVRKRMVLLPFLDSSEKRPKTLVEDARTSLAIDLQKTGAFVLVQASDLNLDLSKYLANGEYKLAEISQAAKAAGINAILEGKLIDIRVNRSADNVGIVRNLTTTFEVVAQVRVVNARSGKEVFNTIKTVSLEQKDVRVAERVETDRFIQNNPELVRVLIKDAFLEFSSQVTASLDRVAWEGRIAAINGDRIFLNVGKISGLQVGDLLRVTDDGEDVYDPESGTHIGKVQGRLKGTLEVISYFGTDGTIAVIHSGGGFKENDRVELY